MPRLFLAIWPDDDVVDELRALPRKDAAGVRFVPPDRWHVTLRFLGEADTQDVVDAVDEAAVTGELPPVPTARLGPAVDVLAERALVVPVQGLEELADAVRSATAAIGEPPRRRFFGHLTLARLAPGRPRFRMPAALGLPVAAPFGVEELALVLSTLGPEGASYETVATWPLLGAEARRRP